MKILIQHRHYENEISGVLTYIHSVIPELESRGAKIKTISTRQEQLQKWLNLILWADVIHMNSNDLLFAIICKTLGKKIIIKYHYIFYQSTHKNYEKMTFIPRIKAEFKKTLPKANYPLKWKLHTAIKWAKLAARISTAFLADYHTACSDFLGESCAFPWQVHTLYNPIAVKHQNILKTPDQLSQPYKFVFVGRLDRDKGVDILLKATKILQTENHQFQILIIGDGAQTNELKTLASELDILNSVHFLGKLTNSEVIYKIEDALALVVPSRWQEPAGYVVLEASSVQTCSIVSKMGGLPEVAGPHSWFFENEDVEGLASCMRECLNNPGSAIERGLLSRAYVSVRFSPQTVAQQLLDIFYQGNIQKTKP
ncbi:MAG: glycosyltransferase family 4 protein [Nostocaceae cyanobacterium]|nr:glycosyltransferase family 4 protein [Nostocaceae cyanobacterium]